jgi:hypothetical protein
MNMNAKQDSNDFKGPRPEEEISFDVSVCSPEFKEGCKDPAGEQLDKATGK